MTHAVLRKSRNANLDNDQSAALRSFVADLDMVLAEAFVPLGYYRRLVNGLASAYYAALAAGNWHFFIGLLSSALDDLEDAGYAPRARAASEFWRLRAMVRENQDLLPPEMLKIG